jgi:hypothetical protein
MEKKILRAPIQKVNLEGLLEGFSVTWKKSISVALMRKLVEASKTVSDDPEVEVPPEESLDAIETLVGILGPRLVSWDLEDENGPLPASEGALEELHIEFLMELFNSFCGLIGELPKAPNSE